MRVVSAMGLPVRAGRRLLGLTAILAAFAIVCLAPTACGVAPAAYGLLLAPAFALFALLLLGFAPGAQLLERLRARRFDRRAPRAPRTLAMRRPIVVRRVVSPAASALAMRPPPLPAAALG
jgi:4-hydroxybenzoate polyprenyltransferase